MTIKRVALMGVGDGGGSMMASKIRWLAENSPETLDSVIAVAANTNARSLKEASREISAIGKGVQFEKIQLGPKTTNRQGSGSLWKVGRQAANESIQDGAFVEFFGCNPVEAVFMDGSFGAGGTALGGLFPLVRHLRDDIHVVVFPDIAHGSVELGNIDQTQSLVMADRLQEFDNAGIPVAVHLVDSIRDQAATWEEAYRIIDQIAAQSLGGFVRVLTNPVRYDHNDLLVRLYANANGKSKRLRMAGAFLNEAEVSNPDILRRAVERVFVNRHFAFDDEEIGGAMVVLEHSGDLQLSQETAITATLKALIVGAYKKDGPTPLHFKPVSFKTGIKPGRVFITLILSQFTGWVTDLSDLPPVKWLDDEDGEDEHLRAEPAPIVAISEAEVLPVPDPVEPKLPVPEVGLVPGDSALPTGEPEPILQPAPCATYGSFYDLVESAEKRGDQAAAEILEHGNPSFDTLPDGRVTNEVLLFTREGEDWAKQVLEALHPLVRLKKQWSRTSADRSISESWNSLMANGLRFNYKGVLLPKLMSGRPVAYDSVHAVMAQTWWGTIQDDERHRIESGCRIHLLFGAALVDELVDQTGKANGKRSLKSLVAGMSGMG